MVLINYYNKIECSTKIYVTDIVVHRFVCMVASIKIYRMCRIFVILKPSSGRNTMNSSGKSRPEIHRLDLPTSFPGGRFFTPLQMAGAY